MNLRFRFAILILTLPVVIGWAIYFYDTALSGWINPVKRVNASVVRLMSPPVFFPPPTINSLIHSIEGDHQPDWSQEQGDVFFDSIKSHDFDDEMYQAREEEGIGADLHAFMNRTLRAPFMISVVESVMPMGMNRLPYHFPWPVYEDNYGRYYNISLVYGTPMKIEDWDYWSNLGRSYSHFSKVLRIESPEGLLKPEELKHLRGWSHLKLNISEKGSRDWTVLGEQREEQLYRVNFYLKFDQPKRTEEGGMNYIIPDQRPLMIGMTGHLNDLTVTQSHFSRLRLKLIDKDLEYLGTVHLKGFTLEHVSDLGERPADQLILEYMVLTPSFLKSLHEYLRSTEYQFPIASQSLSIKQINEEAWLPLLQALAIDRGVDHTWGTIELYQPGFHHREIREAIKAIRGSRISLHGLKVTDFSELAGAKADHIELVFGGIPVIEISKWKWPENQNTPLMTLKNVILPMKDLRWLMGHPGIYDLKLEGKSVSYHHFSGGPHNGWQGNVTFRLENEGIVKE